MHLLFSTISGFIESIWRRWYGGWIEGTKKESLPKWIYNILSSRGTQTIFNLIFLFGVFLLNPVWATTPVSSWLISHGVYEWLIAIVLAVVFQLEFWSRGHGKAFDLGRGAPVNDDGRYQKFWWVVVPNKLIPEKYWYGFLYDFIWMACRYTVGLLWLVPFLWSFNILWLGLITASVYALCWTLQERDSWVFSLIPWQMAGGSTQLAELLIGFIVGFWLMWF